MKMLLGIAVGIAIGLGLALRMTVLSIKKSNDVGDSKGEMRDFGTYVDMHKSEDDLHSIRANAGSTIYLQGRKKKIVEESFLE